MDRPLPLSVAIITLNEEANLKRCLDSVRGLASEVIVLDSGSQDKTREVATAFSAKFHTEAWPGHVVQKNKALGLATMEWVLCLDADEAVSPELAQSIRRALSRQHIEESGFEVNRLSFYLGDWVRHAWHPEWRLRLVRKAAARWAGRDPHDRLEVDGRTARLEGVLFHYSYADLKDHFQRTIRYAQISAEALARDGCRVRWHHLVLAPWAAFLKRLIVKGGWRDGWRGWIIACTAMFSVFAKYAFLLETRIKNSRTP